MDPVQIHLLMVQPDGTNDSVRPEVRRTLGAQSRISRELAVLRKPRRQRARGHGDAEALFDSFRGVLSSLAPIVEHQGFENDLERIRPTLRALRREGAVAVPAIPELNGLELLAPHPFPADLRALAVDAAFE